MSPGLVMLVLVVFRMSENELETVIGGIGDSWRYTALTIDRQISSLEEQLGMSSVYILYFLWCSQPGTCPRRMQSHCQCRFICRTFWDPASPDAFEANVQILLVPLGCEVWGDTVDGQNPALL